MNDELRAEIAERVRRGEQLGSIEAELLSPRPGLDDDERSALWLYAWLEREGAGGRIGRTPTERVQSVHD